MKSELNYRLLLVEDDANLGIVIQDFLESASFSVDLSVNGAEAMQHFAQQTYDLAILDIMLPDTDGFQLAKAMRKKDATIPLIFLTAKSMPEDRIQGLKMGADDYITKPFEPEELKLRILAVLRRYELKPKSHSKANKYVRMGKCRFYPDQLLIKKGESEQELTSTEASLLMLLFENKNRIVTREMAFQSIWGVPDDPKSRNLDVYIGKLRKHLSMDESLCIKSIHSKGYKLDI
jgi:DNA-binding response OmpR family regulator